MALDSTVTLVDSPGVVWGGASEAHSVLRDATDVGEGIIATFAFLNLSLSYR